MIRVSRIHDPPSPEDGKRILVDRLWPRGVSKEHAALHLWLRDVAPSDTLRKWFAHDPAKWEEFRRRYYAELHADPTVWQPLVEEAESGVVTLLYGTRERRYNNAVALSGYLEVALEAYRDAGIRGLCGEGRWEVAVDAVRRIDP